MAEQHSPGTALQFRCMGLGRSLCIIEPRSSAEHLYLLPHFSGRIELQTQLFIARVPDLQGEQLEYFACKSRPVITSRQPPLAFHNGPQRGALRRKSVRTFHHNIRPTFASRHCAQKNSFEDVKVEFLSAECVSLAVAGYSRMKDYTMRAPLVPR